MLALVCLCRESGPGSGQGTLQPGCGQSTHRPDAACACSRTAAVRMRRQLTSAACRVLIPRRVGGGEDLVQRVCKSRSASPCATARTQPPD
eukprot:scaffold8564_cov90-Isochrysis_galbana.AAC.4